MNILDKIIADKRREVALKKAVISTQQLEQFKGFERTPFKLTQRLKSSTSGIIAEHKRRSPSKAIINQNLNVCDVAKGYEAAGACGMSVLTDVKYFGGALEDLTLARASCQLPLLRKEFVIDTYQVIEAKAYGADVILLIAAVLNKDEIKSLSELAQSLGLEVLLEVHNEEELHKSVMSSIDLMGVNNRDLKTFEVNLETSMALSSKIPSDFVKISESGISAIEAIKKLKPFGFEGFLIGENFMKTNDPGESAKTFITSLKQ